MFPLELNNFFQINIFLIGFEISNYITYLFYLQCANFSIKRGVGL